jgi:hypothetical protein
MSDLKLYYDDILRICSDSYFTMIFGNLGRYPNHFTDYLTDQNLERVKFISHYDTGSQYQLRKNDTVLLRYDELNEEEMSLDYLFVFEPFTTDRLRKRYRNIKHVCFFTSHFLLLVSSYTTLRFGVLFPRINTSEFCSEVGYEWLPPLFLDRKCEIPPHENICLDLRTCVQPEEAFVRLLNGLDLIRSSKYSVLLPTEFSRWWFLVNDLKKQVVTLFRNEWLIENKFYPSCLSL